MILEKVRTPIVLAPLAGGPSTPELAAAVSRAGGLGFLAAGYLSPAELGRRMGTTRDLAAGPIAVNLFAPGAGPAEPSVYGPFLDRLANWAQAEGMELGEPRYSEDEWEAKIELLLREPADVVSFTFGCPAVDVLESLQATGSETWVTVTSPEEAVQAERAGAQVLIAQGAEAGGHRASFVDRHDLPVYSLLPLLSLIQEEIALPLVASGGIATGAAIAAVLSAGASAAQIGTAFMLAPEAGTSTAHRAALRSRERTVLTRAFTGRLARGIDNAFIAAHNAGAPVAYPELHHVTSPMRRRAREQGRPELINLWAGEAHHLALPLPAEEIVRRLAADTEAALNAACAKSGR